MVARDKNGIIRFVYRDYTRTCKQCGKEFTSHHSRAYFCSESCSRRRRYENASSEKKATLIKNGAERSRISFNKKTQEEKKAKWDKANKKKSEKNNIRKYGTNDPCKIQEIKSIKGIEKVRASRLERSRQPFYKMKSCLYRRLNYFVSGEQKNCHMEEYLGCSFDELRSYLESKFTDGMTWENHSKHGWHIDHIKPCASFDLTKEDQIKICFHYSNLQPLWAKDNLSKGDKIISPVFSD